MTSFVTSLLHNSISKSKSRERIPNRTNEMIGNQQHSVANSRPHEDHNLGRLATHNASAPALTSRKENNTSSNAYHYQHLQHYNNPECVHAPPPYDNMGHYQHQYQAQIHPQQLSRSNSPTPTPTTSWTSEMNALAQKIKDDVANTFLSKGTKKTIESKSPSNNVVDRHSISQGMKLVSIAADEYDSGNETVALGVYLTGVDKILMALPNKTDSKTKLAISEKLKSVEERVGLFTLANSQKKSGNRDNTTDTTASITIQSLLLSRLAQTINTVTNKAYQKSSSAVHSSINHNACSESSRSTTTTSTAKTMRNDIEEDSLVRFKRLGQCMIDFTVACAIIIKKSPIPGILSFLFGYLVQIFFWVDAQYHIIHKAQNLGIQCLKLGFEADEKYRLHEFIVEGFYMIFAAGLKAAIAYKEAPGYIDERASVAGNDDSKNHMQTSSIVTAIDDPACTVKNMRHKRCPPSRVKRADETAALSWMQMFRKNK